MIKQLDSAKVSEILKAIDGNTPIEITTQPVYDKDDNCISLVVLARTAERRLDEATINALLQQERISCVWSTETGSKQLIRNQTSQLP